MNSDIEKRLAHIESLLQRMPEVIGRMSIESFGAKEASNTLCELWRGTSNGISLAVIAYLIALMFI